MNCVSYFQMYTFERWATYWLHNYEASLRFIVFIYVSPSEESDRSKSNVSS